MVIFAILPPPAWASLSTGQHASRTFLRRFVCFRFRRLFIFLLAVLHWLRGWIFRAYEDFFQSHTQVWADSRASCSSHDTLRIFPQYTANNMAEFHLTSIRITLLLISLICWWGRELINYVGIVVSNMPAAWFGAFMLSFAHIGWDITGSILLSWVSWHLIILAIYLWYILRAI